MSWQDQNIPINYQECLRCGKTWNEVIWHNEQWTYVQFIEALCTNCPATYHQYPTDLEIFIWHVDTITDLRWDLVNQQCLYMKTNEIDITKLFDINQLWSETVLPWIPFSISRERLHTLLVFS